MADLDTADAAKLFHETPMRQVATALARPLSESDVKLSCYRPLDRRFLLVDSRFLDRHRPDLQDAWGVANVCLFSLPSGTGAGPAAWVHSGIPDRHGFRGSYGGYAFPLWDRRLGSQASNINPGIIAGLAGAYGTEVAAQQVFDAVATLLSSSSYTSRFGSDLEESFAHIPFPANMAAFEQAARIGANIRELESFTRVPKLEFRTAKLAGRATGVTFVIPRPKDAFIESGDGTGAIPLQADQSLRITGVPRRVFDFSVSGYRVLYRWLAARDGEAIDVALQRATLDIVWRIQELLTLFDEADAVLAKALTNPLTRTALGLPSLGQDAPAPVE